MQDNRKIISYGYAGGASSKGAVRHALRYFGAIADLALREVEADSDLMYGGDNKNPGIPRCDFLVDELVRKISYGEATESLSAPGDPHTLSGIIAGLTKFLVENGLFDKEFIGHSLWPDNKKFGFTVTHDIDIARRSFPGGVKLLFSKFPTGRLRGLRDTVTSVIGAGRNPYDQIPAWIEMERDLGVKSTYFIFAGGRRNQADPKYRIEDMADRINRAAECGAEIALHSSIGSDKGVGLADAKSKLEEITGLAIEGARPHFLSAIYPDYWQGAENCGLRYTSCLGYDTKIGHLNGIDLPFIPFDTARDRSIDIVEIPIAIMDCGLIGMSPAHLEQDLEKGKAFIDRASRAGSLVVLDWHQRTLYDPDYPGWGELARQLIEYSLGQEAAILNMKSIAGLLRGRYEEAG